MATKLSEQLIRAPSDSDDSRRSLFFEMSPYEVPGEGNIDHEFSGTRCNPNVELTVVVPFYNPGEAIIRQTVSTAISVLTDAAISFEILAVSDGSSDGSERALVPLLSDTVRCLVISDNQGKGRAVRTGLEYGRGAYLGFIDGDGDIPPDHLVSFASIARHRRPALVIGSKRHPESAVIYPRLRRLYSWAYQKLVRCLFGLSVQDTQVGIKLIRRDVAQIVLPMMRENRFAFDLELLVLARHEGFEEVCEAPVRINARNGSTVSIKAIVSMVRDTLESFGVLKYAARMLHGPPGRT